MIFFAIFFQPILNWISNVIVDVIGWIYHGYLDDVFYQATVNPGDQIVSILFLMFIVMPTILATLMVIRASISNRVALQPRMRRKLFWLSIPVLSAVLLITSAGPIISVGINNSFQRALMALGPGITEQERKELLKDWGMMKSEADYKKIRDKVEAVAMKYNLELPVKRQSSHSSVIP